MSERFDSDPDPELEKALRSLFHKPNPDPAFVDKLSRELLRRGQETTTLSWREKLFGRLTAFAPVVAWSAMAAILIFAMLWSFNNLIPTAIPAVLVDASPVAETTSLETWVVTGSEEALSTEPSGQEPVTVGPVTGRPPESTPAPGGATPTSNLYTGWLQYTNATYGFSFRYPEDWKLEEEANVLRLIQQPADAPTLAIGYRWAQEKVRIRQPLAGRQETVARGDLTFLGKTISRDVLVEAGQDRAVFYNRAAEFSSGNLVFRLGLQDQTSSSDVGMDIPEETQETADKILASFQFVPEEIETEPTNLGKLAFVRGGDIYVKNLTDGSVQRLASGGGHRQPRWSPSGDWLAFRKGDDQVWVVRSDGERAQALNEGGKVGAFAWSPARDWLAYVAGSGELRLASAEGKDLRILVPRLGSRTIHRLAWSPAGDWIAYQVIQNKANQEKPYIALWKVAIDGGKPAELYVGNPTLAGWTGNGRGILFWDGGETFSASLLADGAPLAILPASGGQPQTIAKAVLVYPDFVQPDPAGSARVAAVIGGPREAWQNKLLYLFDDGRSAQLSSSEYAASSPAWAPDGSQVAFVNMPVLSEGEKIQTGLMERRIWVRDLQKVKTRPLTSDADYRDEYPLWSADGKMVLFVRLDAQNQASVWLVPVTGGEPVPVIDTLGSQGDGLGYYGHIDWGDLIDWWR